MFMAIARAGERFTTRWLNSRTPTIFFDREGEPSPFSKFPTKVSASVQNGGTLDRKFRWLALDFHLRYPRGGLRRAFPSCYPVRERISPAFSLFPDLLQELLERTHEDEGLSLQAGGSPCLQ